MIIAQPTIVIVYKISILVLSIAIIVLLFALKRDYRQLHKTNTTDTEPQETKEEKTKATTNKETITELQIEKAKTDIEASRKKAELFKSISDFIGLFNALLVLSILFIGIAFIAGMASCAGLSTNLKF